MTKNQARKKILSVLRFLALAAFLIFAVGPLFWIIITSLKSSKEVYTFPIKYFPNHPTLDSYRKLFSLVNFGTYIKNSFFTTSIGSLGAVIFSIFGGYALSRIKGKRYANKMLLVLYFTQTVPAFILMVPLYTMIVKLHGTDNLVVLGLIYMVTVLAFCTIMAKSFFDRIPVSIEEAACIDGCTTSQALFKVILPLIVPGMVAVFSFAFTNIWNELFVAIMFLSSSSKMTIPVALNGFISKAGISWDIMSAGLVMALLPTMLIFAIGQKYIVAGLTEGSVKE